jgi:hypothetical protein
VGRFNWLGWLVPAGLMIQDKFFNLLKALNNYERFEYLNK